MREEWRGFKGNKWTDDIDVRDFIQKNYTPYDGDESFLEGPTEATDILWGKVQELQKEERAKGGVLDCETEVVSGLTAYGPGYIDEKTKDLEQIVGLQTDKPLKRAFMPYGGIKMAEEAARTTDITLMTSSIRYFQNTTRHTTRLFLTLIHRKCGRQDIPILSQVFRIPMDGAGLSAITEG